MKQDWTTNDIPDQAGKTIVITGANSGLGLESTRVLAGKGAHIVMACRNLEKGEAAKQEVLAQVPNASLDLMQLDLGSLDSVRAFADAYKAKYDRLDVLMNNAGIMAIPYRETADGFETQFGVNHLGHFALTGLLMDVILKTPNARIMNVTSSANWFGKINLDDLNSKQNYDRWGAYGQSKLANILFTFELQRRLDAAGADVMTNTAHPGFVITNLQVNSSQQSETAFEWFMYQVMEPILGQDVSMGVLSQLYGAVATDAKPATFYGPRTFNVRGYPKAAKANKIAYDESVARRLWEVSEQMTGVTYDALQTQPTTA